MSTFASLARVATCALLAFSVAGCGGEPDSTTTQSSAPVQSSSSTPLPGVTSSPAAETPEPTPAATEEVEAPTEDTVASDGTVGVKDLGWGVAADNEFMTWGAVLTNSGGDRSIVEVTATGLDKAGNAIDTSDATLFRMPNGQALVGGVFLEKGIKKVELSIDSGTPYSEGHTPITGTVSGKVKVTGSGYDAIVSVRAKSTLDLGTKDAMSFYIVFRDSKGKITGGAQGFTPGAIKAGQARSIALQSAMSNPPPDRFATASIFFDVSDSYMDAS